MKTLSTLLLAILFSFSLTAQNLEEVLDKHFQVIDQKNFAKVKTLIVIGKTVSNGMENEYTMTMVKPNHYRLDVPMQGQTMVQAYNDGEAWYIAPWTGSLEPKDIAGDQLKSMEKQADLDGPLYNWEEKGNKVELLPNEEFDGIDVFKIQVTDKHDDVSFIFIDAENFVILKEESTTIMQGQEVKSVTYYSNYKPIGDTEMIMPYNFETHFNGQLASTIIIEEITIDPEVDMSIFKKPDSN